MCAAMPHRFVRHPVSNMYALSAVVFGAPPCVNAACANIVFCKVSALRWGWCLCYLFPVAPARSPCVFFCVVFACGGGPLGLGEGHQACKVDRDFPHFPGVYSIYSYYTVYLHFLEQATSPPGQPGAPVGLLGLGEGHQACQSTEISHTSWRFFNLLFVYNVLTFFGAHHFSPRSAWCTHPGFL